MGQKKYLKKNEPKFLQIGKQTNLHNQEAQWIQNKINIKKTTPRHVIANCWKPKTKSWKLPDWIQGTIIWITKDSQSKQRRAETSRTTSLKCWKNKNVILEFWYQWKYSLIMKEKLSHFQIKETKKTCF